MITVFNPDGLWNQEFLNSTEFREFGKAADKLLHLFEQQGGDVRHLSHAMQSEIGIREVICLGRKRRAAQQAKKS